MKHLIISSGIIHLLGHRALASDLGSMAFVEMSPHHIQCQTASSHRSASTPLSQYMRRRQSPHRLLLCMIDICIHISLHFATLLCVPLRKCIHLSSTVAYVLWQPYSCGRFNSQLRQSRESLKVKRCGKAISKHLKACFAQLIDPPLPPVYACLLHIFLTSPAALQGGCLRAADSLLCCLYAKAYRSYELVRLGSFFCAYYLFAYMHPFSKYITAHKEPSRSRHVSFLATVLRPYLRLFSTSTNETFYSTLTAPPPSYFLPTGCIYAEFCTLNYRK